jgi:hypothetical protein
MTRAMEAIFVLQVAHCRCQISSDPPPVLHDAAAAGFEKHDPGAGRPEAVGSLVQPDLLLVRSKALPLASPSTKRPPFATTDCAGGQRQQDRSS